MLDVFTIYEIHLGKEDKMEWKRRILKKKESQVLLKIKDRTTERWL